MTLDDAGGLTVDLKLFMQLIKKNDVANQIGYRLQLMHSVSRAGRDLSCLVSKCTPSGVSLSESNCFYLFFILFHKPLLTANQAISNHVQKKKKKQKKQKLRLLGRA